MTGPDSARIRDTYLAALQHDLFDPQPDETLVGVVRRPTRWFAGAVDENVPALGPPADLLDAVKDEEETLKMRGICDEEAHNAAWDAVDFDARYRAHLRESPEASEAMDDLLRRVHDGEGLVLVCFENTEKKHCHRTILRAELDRRLADDGTS
ncbi:DUF488 domain-containing protein [Haloarchaeobius sp. HME9146]|uniref:DUF488 domain-containing protein n=1 Tax=Haloarchaeobius sp. HME9146 TaxID=2978732 RepID=UPI0021BEFAF4|nr:DUF488 domain-containing protein [Haloarchaeobius sp. HME9146]